MQNVFSLFVVLNLSIVLFGCQKAGQVVTNSCDINNYTSNWQSQSVESDGISHPVYLSKSNNPKKPPLIILHQINGLSCETMAYAQTFTDKYSVYVPLLFGEYGMDDLFSGGVNYYFNGEWSPVDNRPIYTWAQSWTETIAQQNPGQPIGVIGMCLTGTMPLALLGNLQIKAVVVAQPSLPLFAFSEPAKQSLDLSVAETETAVSSTETNDVKILGLRFQNDTIASGEKLKTLRNTFVDAFIDLEICASEYQMLSQQPIKEDAHSVLINEWHEDLSPLHPVEERRQLVKQFFDALLLGEGNVPASRACATKE